MEMEEWAQVFGNFKQSLNRGIQNYYRIATNISVDANNLNRAVMTVRIKLIRQPLYDRSIEYADNRIAKYSVQKGRCAVTGEKFTSTEEIHCHHKIPKSQGGKSKIRKLNVLRELVGNKPLKVD